MPRQSPTAVIQDFAETLRERARRFRTKYANLLHPGAQVVDPFEGQPTAALPEGALFASDGNLYQVIETGGGFNFARLWQGASRDRVALDPNSVVARFNPVIAYGEPLPMVASKGELLDNAGRVLCFVFPSASMAERSARLDEAVANRSGLRLYNIRSGLVGLTDGLRFYRLYTHWPPAPEMFERLELPGIRQVVALDASEGPYYWIYLKEPEPL